MEFTTWRELLAEELTRQGEGDAVLVGCNLCDDKLRGVFGRHWPKDDGELQAWTKNRVYFSTKDGELTVIKSAKRNPV